MFVVDCREKDINRDHFIKRVNNIVYWLLFIKTINIYTFVIIKYRQMKISASIYSDKTEDFTSLMTLMILVLQVVELEKRCLQMLAVM